MLSLTYRTGSSLSRWIINAAVVVLSAKEIDVATLEITSEREFVSVVIEGSRQRLHLIRPFKQEAHYKVG